MNSRHILLLSVLALSSCSRTPSDVHGLPDDRVSSTSARSDIPADAPLVVFLGDSLSAGLNLAAEEAFPAVAQTMLAKRGHPFRLVNAGVSGDTSVGGLQRVDWLLKQKPDVLVIELGANDGLRGGDVAHLETNLRDIIERANNAGTKVLLLGMHLPTSLGQTYVDDFAAIYPRLARELDVAFVPFFMKKVGGVTELTMADGLHPTANGHVILAENIAPALESLLDGLKQRKR